MTQELQALREWLKVVDAAPEGDFELIVGNARHVRNVPGRKTDVKNAEWVADFEFAGRIRYRIARNFVVWDLRSHQIRIMP
jgi:transposase